MDGQDVLGHVFNGVTVDGEFGLLTRDGASSFESVRVRTDDPAFAAEEESEPAGTGGGGPADGMAGDGDSTIGDTGDAGRLGFDGGASDGSGESGSADPRHRFVWIDRLERLLREGTGPAALTTPQDDDEDR